MGSHAHVRCFAGGFVGLVALVPVGARGQGTPIIPTFEEVISLKEAGNVSIAPDGSAVAFTVTSTDWDENRYDTEIWLVRLGQEPFQLTRTQGGSSTDPGWSPDGRWVSFLADRGEQRQLYLIRPEGGEALRVTSIEEGVGDYAWSPEGDRIALAVTEPESERDRALKKRYGSFVVEDKDFRMTHLWVMDISEEGTGGEPRRLTGGGLLTVGSFAWSPDGSSIAFEHRATPLINDRETDISLVGVESAGIRALVTGPGPDLDPKWSPDGDWVLFTDFGGDLESVYYLNRDLARVRASGGATEVLTAGFDESPAGAVWTDKGIFFNASQGTRRVLFRLDLESKETVELELGFPMVGGFGLSADERTMAFTAEGPDQLEEVYVVRFGPEGGLASTGLRMTHMTDQVADWPLGTREVIQWRSEDGTAVEGVLFKPGDFDPAGRYPLLVQIHGGPTGTSRPTAVPGGVYPVLQWLAKGAIVLMPNYRGSGGYGEAFRSLNVRNLGVGDMWDVMSGVDFLVDAGIADPARLGAMGWGQGGYISAFLATNTGRFRGISVGAGISDWMTYYVNTDIHPFTRQYLKATPWDDPGIYALTSPITNIREASTPTLIQHGEFDRRVPLPNAYELFQGLQDQGVDTRLVVYKGFGHRISKPRERLAALWHNWQWFARHIWGEEIELPAEGEEKGPLAGPGSPSSP